MNYSIKSIFMVIFIYILECPGLEPRFSACKADVLPIKLTPPLNV